MKTANALGFATNYITGLNEWAAWGSMDMYFHPGIAAKNGITAAEAAKDHGVLLPEGEVLATDFKDLTLAHVFGK